MKTNRREWLGLTVAGSAAIAAIWLGVSRRGTVLPRLNRPVVDFHTHLFGAGDAADLADDERCHLSPQQKRHWNYGYLRRLLEIPHDASLDTAYVERLVEQLRQSSVDRAVLLAQDARYDDQGRLDLARTTSIYVPNRYLFRVVREHPELLIPCPSINPRRRDAFDELDFCFEQGARVLKIHPPTQDVDPGDPRWRPFFRRCAEIGMRVMIHTGMEHAAEIVGNDYSHPRRLESALEEGCDVIAAHTGMGAFFDREDFYPDFVAMIRRFPRLTCDTAVLASMFRWRNLRRMLADTDVLERTVHGSDFPFPSNAMVFWNQISPRAMNALVAEKNLFDRDLYLKLALGFPEEVFYRAGEWFDLEFASEPV